MAKQRRRGWVALLACAALVLLAACAAGAGGGGAAPQEPPGCRWAIYRLDLSSGQATLLYGAPYEISSLRVDSAGERMVFSQRLGGDDYEHTEIMTLGADGEGLQQLTHNDSWDVYPAWSPDGSQIAYLCRRQSTLDVCVMAADGSGQRLLYDSGYHDADIDWVGDQIAFTRESRIWLMRDDGSGARQLTDPPHAGEWGQADLPLGDYDPRISPDGSRVVFSRMVAVDSPHGSYDLYAVDVDGASLTRLTDTGYAQGLAAWSHSGDRLLYIVAAAGGEGRYDLYLANADGSGSHNITPRSFPPRLLIHWAVFSPDDSGVYLIGEWWPRP